MIRLLRPLSVFIVVLILASSAYAIKPVYTSTLSNTAIEGYDTVAYFRSAQDTLGVDEYKTQYMGVIWKFSSAENLALFKSDPDRYMPQYGGYCAYAVAQDTTASGDPHQWSIVGGKLYLNYNADIKKRWKQDIQGYIEKADRNWPSLVSSGQNRLH